jgi:ketosteroid isomerase-like protein
MPDEQANRKLMLSVTAAWREGDMEPLLAALHPDVVWRATAPKEFFRFGGVHHGITGVREYIALHASRYSLTRFEPKSVTAKSDQVWGLFEIEALHIPSRKYVRSDCSIRWTVKDGQVIEHQAIFDTAAVLQQQGELTAA